jgi:hypothetical protein
MGRCDYGRTPFARAYDDDTIYIGSVPDAPVIDQESPMSSPEVGKFLALKEDSRKRGLAIDYDPANGELKVLAFFCRITLAMLAEYLRDARKEGKTVKSMSLLLDVESSRDMRFELHQAGFVRDESKDQPLYRTWVHPLTKKKRVPKAEPVEPPKPVPELKLTMTAQQYADKQAELEALNAKIEALKIQALKPQHDLCWS